MHAHAVSCWPAHVHHKLLLTCPPSPTQARKELNIHPIKPEVTLVDMAVTLLQLGLATPKSAS